MNMVALPKESPPPASNCDRYGHPLRDSAPSLADEALEQYLSGTETQVTERWSQLYRKLYEDRGSSVSQEELVAVIRATLHALSQESSYRIPTFAEGARRRVQRRICLAGWECHSYLIPAHDWEDPEDLQAVRGALKRRLLLLLDHLIA